MFLIYIYGHVIWSEGLAKLIIQGNVEGKIRCGRPKKMWIDNIKEWTGKSIGETQLTAHERGRNVEYLF